MSGRKGKTSLVKVIFLDDTVQVFQVPAKAYGATLYTEVVKKLKLIEADYFDLEFTETSGCNCWLDREKPVLKQLNPADYTLRFVVKFYTPDPGLLEDEYTRYLFALQIRRDLLTGVIPCQDHTAVLLASYIAQAELGDFIEDEYVDHTYLKTLRLLPNQTDDLEIKIMEHHREHIGQTPPDAEFNLLDTARKVELYGIKMHPAKDHEGVSLNLAVAHMGVLVFQGYTKINTFSWAKIRKLSFKRKKFLTKLHPEGYGYYKDTVEFYFDTRNECKNFWKKCIEHHAFFRCHSVKRLARNKTRVVSKGSSFRYCGRTQKQLTEFVRDHFVKRSTFERSASQRTMASVGKTPTPNTGTLNSKHEFLMHNTSSGSHTLERAHTIENDGSPKRSDRARSTERPNDKKKSALEQLERTTKASLSNNNHALAQDGVPPQHHLLNPQQFMLGDRKFSEPVMLGSEDEERRELARSPEIEDIPEKIEHINSLPAKNFYIQSSPSLKRVQSDVGRPLFTSTPYSGNASAAHSVTSDSKPPPPPPPYEEVEKDPYLKRLVREETITTRSTTSAASITITSDASVTSSRGMTDESEEENRRRRLPIDRSYFIAKELLMTERTYKKDLEVLTVFLRNSLSRDDEDLLPSSLADTLFCRIDQIYEFHCALLIDIEQRVAQWEGKNGQPSDPIFQRIGDIILKNCTFLQYYTDYLEHHDDILTELELACRRNKKFEVAIREFEMEKVCYLPLHAFLLKPVQRLQHYLTVFKELVDHYDDDHIDKNDCQTCLSKISSIFQPYQDQLRHLENVQKLIELQREMTGIDGLATASRQFVREGCLQKLSRKGYQQRMFFLFSDMLVYASRTSTPVLQFKVHGQLPLKGMKIEEAEERMGVSNSFTIYGGSRSLLVAAGSKEEKDKWSEDLKRSINQSQQREDDNSIRYPSLKSNSSSDNLEDNQDHVPFPLQDKQGQHRANTTMHVCWHRNSSVSMTDLHIAYANQLSGYLLRKFKNSNGWQKLWVVFTNFCLFFYKSFQDDYPLASLPLIGYTICEPSEADNIQKDYVFKLQFKNHVYFFRAESQYTFHRWMQVIFNSTRNTSRKRIEDGH